MDSDWVRLDVTIEVPRHQSVFVHKDSESYKKFLHWKSTNLDSDFEDLVEYIAEDVEIDMDLYIEYIRES